MAAKFVDEDLTAAADLKAPNLANRFVQAYVLFNNTLYQNKVPIVFGASRARADGQVCQSNAVMDKKLGSGRGSRE